MGLSIESGPAVGTVDTIVTSGRGLNPDELTRMLLPKILYIGPDAPADVRAAGEAQRQRLEVLLKHYFAQAQRSERTSIFNVLMNAGHPDAANIVKEI